MISIIIPANNEEGYIGECLRFLLASQDPVRTRHVTGVEDASVQVIVVANGCSDATVREACAKITAFTEKGWQLDVLDIEQGGKTNALNCADAAAIHDMRVYIDADIHVSDVLVSQLVQALDRLEPAYAGGRPHIRPARSFVSERYARFWEHLPFMATGVPGCGVYGVNAKGRERWADFPDVIADDTFVRYNFAPNEMYGVKAPYSWPITEGFGNLVRVRRRQNEGLDEIRRLWPNLARRMKNTAPDRKEKVRLFLKDPIGFTIYATVSLAVYLPLFRNRSGWDRGR